MQSQSDVFDRIPDPLVLSILNRISDIKTLIRCRAVSRRFNSLVPQADSLLLRVDRVISATEPASDGSFFFSFLRSVYKSLHDLISPKPLPNLTHTQNSPTRILRGFDRIRELDIELPSGHLRLEKGAVIRWKAEFGRSLKSSVILGFRWLGDAGGGEAADLGGGGSLKMRVVWTINALIAASARHYMMLEVVRERNELEKLVVTDREEEGTVVMYVNGMRECRESESGDGGEDEVNVAGGGRCGGGNGVWWRKNRTTVPAVRMRMRHEPRLELAGGVRMDGATLVVVRPIMAAAAAEWHAEEDVRLAFRAFSGGLYGEAVEKLLKSRSYLLEMNSF